MHTDGAPSRILKWRGKMMVEYKITGRWLR
jgi:hypothetical protein